MNQNEPEVRKIGGGIRAVSLDGDGTLWDVWAAARIALSETAYSLNERYDLSGDRSIDVAELEDLRRQIARSHHDWSMKAVRCQSFVNALARRSISLDASDLDVEELWDTFLERRQAATIPYGDAVAFLTRMTAGGCRTALLSNGNTHPETVDLNHFFDAVLLSEVTNIRKPDVEAFRAVSTTLGVPLNEIVHIGDDKADDYDAAKAAGMKALLLCRAHSPSCTHGDEYVTTLADV